ncbi:MAG: hypothetical protein RIC55_03095 [Pirellulaceae bacterium]
MEQLRIRLQRPIAGVDHLNAVDPEKFADLHGQWDGIAGQLDIDRINDFYVYEGEYGKDAPKWHRAADGLKAIRVVLEYYRSGRGDLTDAQRAETVSVFERVESILDDADLHDVKFCFVGDY